MNFKILCSLLITSCLISCSERTQENPNFITPPESKFVLEDHSELLIKLDSITPYYSNCIQYEKTDSLAELITLNTFKSVLNFYSFETKKIIKRIDLKTTPLTNPNEFDGFCYINKDSIIISSSTKNRLALIDGAGSPLKEYKITPNDSNSYFSSPTISSVNPMIKLGKKINVSGFLGPRIDPFSAVPEVQTSNLNLSIDLLSGTTTPSISYPANYVGKLWGANMMFVYRTFNDKNEAVYSFPSNHNLYIDDFNGGKREVLGASTMFERIFSMKKDELDAESRAKYYLENPSYGPIIFDKYRKVYYRIAYQRISKEDFDSKDLSRGKIKQASIIILDEEFRFLGETVLPRFSYTETMAFVTSEGLCLGKWEKSKLNEDDLIFGIFKLIKK